jgi:hypothetical protein
MDNSLGTWKLNVGKSKYTPAPLPFKSQNTIRSASDGGVKVTSTGVQADGKPLNSSYTVKYDGKDCPVTGAPFDTIAMKQVDANTLTITAKQAGGKFHATGQTVISKDGKVLTTTVNGKDADGKALSATLVYDKQ